MSLTEELARVPLFTLVEHLRRLDPNARIRFLEDPRLVFHPSDVTEVRERRGDDGRIFEIRTPILGVLGSGSPLASFFTEDVLRSLSNDDDQVLAFFDTLHHRVVELLIEAERRASPGRIVRIDGEDTFSRRARATAGIPNEAPHGVRREAFLGLGRLLGVRPRTTDALDAALQLALPEYSIRIDDFIARDIPLADGQNAVLGRHAVLGTALLGGHVIGQTGLVRLAFGRVHDDELADLSPGGRLHRVLSDVVDRTTGGFIEAEIDVEIARGHEPLLRLGDETTRVGAGALLGRADDAPPLHVRIPLHGDRDVTYSE